MYAEENRASLPNLLNTTKKKSKHALNSVVLTKNLSLQSNGYVYLFLDAELWMHLHNMIANVVQTR